MIGDRHRGITDARGKHLDQNCRDLTIGHRRQADQQRNRENDFPRLLVRRIRFIRIACGDDCRCIGFFIKARDAGLPDLKRNLSVGIRRNLGIADAALGEISQRLAAIAILFRRKDTEVARGQFEFDR